MNGVILPILIPLITGIFLLFWVKPSLARSWFAVGSFGVQTIVGLVLAARVWVDGTLVLPLGNWGPTLGVTLVADGMAAGCVVVAAVLAAVAAAYGLFEMPIRWSHPLRWPLLHFLMVGVQMAFLTGDLFNLFVAFEVTLIASYALLTLEADDWDVKQALPYISLNLISSAVFLAAAGFVYSVFGSLNFAEIARQTPALRDDPRLWGIVLMLLFVFGLKAGVVPLFYWLPNAYPIVPTPVAALFGGVLTKVGIYCMMRMFGVAFPIAYLPGLSEGLVVVGLITAIIGGCAAVSRGFIRGILSFHIISQIGLMLVGVGLGTVEGYAATLLLLWHNMLVKGGLFLGAGVAAGLCRTDELARMGGVWRLRPWTGLAFLLLALALAGVPPLSGFWGKLLLFKVAVAEQRWFLLGGVVLAGMLTLFSMLKIWLSAFWSERHEAEGALSLEPRWQHTTRITMVLAASALLLGLGAEGFVRVAFKAAAGALDASGYIESVLSVTGKEEGEMP
jgi:multicomponent Na+:H+ antiporter subunit D